MRIDKYWVKRIPSHLCGYSIFKEVEHNALPLQCGMYIMTSFPRVQYGNGGNVRLQWGN